MATCGSRATIPFLPVGPRALVAAGLFVAAAACASAAVEHSPRPDASETGGAGGANGGAGGQGGAGQGGQSSKGGQGGSTATGPCDPFSNAGCSSEQKCTALQSGSALQLGCGSKGSRAAGETCTPVLTGSAQSGDDCDEGLACFKLANEEKPTCHRLCSTSSTACVCPTDELCSLFVSKIDALGYAFCRPVVKCKPLEQNGCGTGEGCYFSTSACYTGALCARAGNTEPGGACAVANECKSGSTCLLVGNSGTCSSFCSTDDSGPSCEGTATGGDTCAALGDPNDHLGSCRQPTP